jgi:Putative motility protein
MVDRQSMDISALSSQLSSIQLQNQIGIAVVKKGQDIAKQQGEAAVALIDSAASIQQSQGQVGANGRLDTVG